MRTSIARAQAKHTRIFLLAGFGLLAGLILLAVWFGQAQRISVTDEEAAVMTQNRLTHILFTVLQAESGQRGYLLTGDPAYLSPYESALTQLPQEIAALQAVSVGPDAAAYSDAQAIIAKKMTELAKTIALYKGGDKEGAIALVKTNAGLHDTERLRDLVSGIQADLAKRRSELRAGSAHIGMLFQAVAFLGVAITLILGWFAVRENHAQTEEVLVLNEQLNRIYTLSSDILAVSNEASGFISLSPAWTQITGRPAAEGIGKTYRDFVHPDDLTATETVTAKAHPDGPMLRFENRIRRADGSYRWIAWRAVPLPEEGLVYSIGRDITDEKVRDAQLRQSQKMEVVGQLTGGIAHDFNNLLTIILGSLELLRRGLDNADAQSIRRIDAALDGARRAASLTHRLLAYARRQPLEPKVIDPNKAVSGMSEILHRVLGEHIALEFVSAAGLWRVLADPNQLENAILNLAINARDAMEPGGHLTIETQNVFLDDAYAARENDVLPGQYVLIAATDTGSGMSPDIASKAFEPFFTTKPAGQGTGLGLAQVYGFIKQSNGHIKIYSEPGHGTTVKLYLPRLRAAGAEAEPETATMDEADARGRGETILVVEDEENVRKFAVDVLQDYGYHVVGVDNAASALPVIETVKRIDLLFTDVVLTGNVDGRQLADMFLQKRPAGRVLFTTGYTRNAIIHHGRLDDGIEFIGKPFSAVALAQKIRRILDRAQARPDQKFE